jgi:hypothetical protein
MRPDWEFILQILAMHSPTSSFVLVDPPSGAVLRCVQWRSQAANHTLSTDSRLLYSSLRVILSSRRTIVPH